MLGLPFRDGERFGRVVNLYTGDDTSFEISRLDVVQAAERVRLSVEAMQSLLADPDRNIPLPMEQFPLAGPERRRSCQFCPFYNLCEEELRDMAALPKPRWKAKLREEWRVATGRRVEVKRPRHTVDEVAAIFAALPHGDPRLRLLVELAAELRAGQAVRARRSDLHLGEAGGFGLGRFVVHGAGRKHGETVDLHPELRALVDEVLSTGYLVEAEAAFRRGQVEDYYLFPAGKLKRGTVPLERATKQPLSYMAIRSMFVAVERIAGVEHQQGRSFYGLRRQATDLAPGSRGTPTAPPASESTRTRTTSGCAPALPKRAGACAASFGSRSVQTPRFRPRREPIPLPIPPRLGSGNATVTQRAVVALLRAAVPG